MLSPPVPSWGPTMSERDALPKARRKLEKYLEEINPPLHRNDFKCELDAVILAARSEAEPTADTALREAATDLVKTFGPEVWFDGGYPIGKISWNREGDSVSAIWVALALDAATRLAKALAARSKQGETP